MKNVAISITLASLLVSPLSFADETAEKVSLKNVAYQVSAAPSKLARDTNNSKSTSAPDQRGENTNAMPDPALLPYVNDGHYSYNGR